MAKLLSPSGRVIKPDDRMRIKVIGVKIAALGWDLKRIYKIRN